MKYGIYEDGRNQNCSDKKVKEYSDTMNATIMYICFHFLHILSHEVYTSYNGVFL